MDRVGAFFLGIAGLLSLATAAPTAAAPVAAPEPAVGRARIHWPATLRRLQDLHFAYLSVTAAGTAVINPNTDVMTTTGGVVHIAGLPYAALFEGVAPSRGVVIVRIPTAPITLTRVGGSETMTVSNWTLSGNSRRTVVAQEPFSFKVGGTLYVSAGQAEGYYVGNFTVDIQYP